MDTIANEKSVLAKWKNNTTLNPESSKEFKYVDGPPYGTGNFHYGHLLVGYIKDAVIRFMRMKGYNVDVKLGKDCHGLPVEMIANKLLGLSDMKDIKEYGVNKYDEYCANLVNKYSSTWLPVMDRMARDYDKNNQYATMNVEYMENVWSVFQKLWNKGLIYKGAKIMPYSTKCNTPLSNFEESQAYKDVIDKTIYLKFKLVEQMVSNNVYLLVWTSTPWTVPMNLALCVNANMEYSLIMDKKTEEYYIIATKLIKTLYKCKTKYTEILTLKGFELAQYTYHPIYDTYNDIHGETRQIVVDDYVSDTSGTGIVHMAPAFGEDDNRVCKENNLLKQNIIDYCPIDDNGYFRITLSDQVSRINESDQVSRINKMATENRLYGIDGLYFLEANNVVIKQLKTDGYLYQIKDYKHSYPHCWRTDTPLIYKPVSSYFLKTTDIKEEIIENNKKINWYPNYIGTKRFGEWLDNIRDWCVSRTRYFGTPLPIWVSDDGKEIIVVGSVDELVELAELDYRPTNLHRHSIDTIKIKSKQGKGYLTRIPDVFDCWFDSGCVPYAQDYNDNKSIYTDKEYLADFVCEGIDQTRGWFYTTLVISTALENKIPFKNILCTGLVLAEDGKKMSKSKQNYTPIEQVFDKYGSDAVRLYLISSSAAHGDSMKFKVTDLDYITRQFNQLYSCYTLFEQQKTLYVKSGNRLVFSDELTNLDIIDQWIINKLNYTVKSVDNYMKSYEIYQVKELLYKFIDNLTKWYLKFKRNHLNGKNGLQEQHNSLNILYYLLTTFTKILFPFMPLFASNLYDKLYNNIGRDIRYEYWPEVKYENDSNQVDLMIKIIEGVRTLRTKSKKFTSNKKPISQLRIYTPNQVTKIIPYLKNELNLLDIKLTDSVCVEYLPVANKKSLFKKFKKDAKDIIRCLNRDELPISPGSGGCTFNGCKLVENEDYTWCIENNYECEDNELSIMVDDMVLVINTDETDEVMSIYNSNLFIRLIQIAREKAGLKPWNKIEVYYKLHSNYRYVQNNKEYIEHAIGYNIYPDNDQDHDYIISLNSKELTGNNHKYIGLDQIDATISIHKL